MSKSINEKEIRDQIEKFWKKVTESTNDNSFVNLIENLKVIKALEGLLPEDPISPLAIKSVTPLKPFPDTKSLINNESLELGCYYSNGIPVRINDIVVDKMEIGKNNHTKFYIIRYTPARGLHLVSCYFSEGKVSIKYSNNSANPHYNTTRYFNGDYVSNLFYFGHTDDVQNEKVIMSNDKYIIEGTDEVDYLRYDDNVSYLVLGETVIKNGKITFHNETYKPAVGPSYCTDPKFLNKSHYELDQVIITKIRR